MIILKVIFVHEIHIANSRVNPTIFIFNCLFTYSVFVYFFTIILSILRWSLKLR